MTVAFSSLRDLFLGDEDAPPVYKASLVALICEALHPPPAHSCAVAERLFAELVDIGPRTAAKYSEVIGGEAMAAIHAGFELWKRHEDK